MYRRAIAITAAFVGVIAGGSLALAQDASPHTPFKAFRSDGKDLFTLMPDGKWVRVAPNAHSPHATRFTSQYQLGEYYLGLALQDVSDTLRSQLKLDEGVAIAISSVADESPASEAGLMQHDLLIRVDGEEIVSHAMLIDAVQNAGKEDRTLALDYMRAGEMQSLEMKPKKREADAEFRVPRPSRVSPEQEKSFTFRVPENAQGMPEWILEHLQSGNDSNKHRELQEQIDDLRGQLEKLQDQLKDQAGDE